MKKTIQDVIGDMTFVEIYSLLGWNLNITVTYGSKQTELKLLNYLTSPNVVVWSAVLASCSMPGIFEAVDLM